MGSCYSCVRNHVPSSNSTAGGKREDAAGTKDAAAITGPPEEGTTGTGCTWVGRQTTCSDSACQVFATDTTRTGSAAEQEAAGICFVEITGREATASQSKR